MPSAGYDSLTRLLMKGADPFPFLNTKRNPAHPVLYIHSQHFSLHAVLSVLHQKETLKPQELDYVCFMSRFQHLLQSTLSLTIPPLVVLVSNVYCGAWHCKLSVKCLHIKAC